MAIKGLLLFACPDIPESDGVEPEATIWRSGEKATECIQLECPSRVCISTLK